MKYVFCEADHKKHLLLFISALTELVAQGEFQREFPAETKVYKRLIEYARDMVENGYKQEELIELNLHDKPTFWTYRDWSPPLKLQNGVWSCPEWFEQVDKLHKRVVDAAFDLRCTGESSI